MLNGIAARKGDPLTPVIVKETDRPAPVSTTSREHQRRVPGPDARRTPSCAHYPHGTLAAQLFGYVSEVSKQELKQASRSASSPATRSARPGVEARVRRATSAATPGLQRLRVDSLGSPQRLGRSRAAAAARATPSRLTLDLRLQKAAQQRARLRHPARARLELLRLLGRERRRDRRARPARRLGARARVGADVQPRRLLGPRHDEGARGAGADAGHRARRRTTRRSNRALVGGYPPGSTFKPVTAIAAMQQHLVSPYAPEPCTRLVHVAARTAGTRSSRTGIRTSTRRSTCRPRSRSRATRTSTGSATRSTSCPRARPSAAGVGEQLRLRPPHRHRRRARGGGLLPTPEWRQQHVQGPTTRQALEAGRLDPARDRPEGPARHAAADGALLRADRERRQARDAAPAARASSSRAPAAPRRTRPRRPPQQINIDPARARRRARGAARGDARPVRDVDRPSSAASRSTIAGKTGTAEKAVDPGRRDRAAVQPVVVVRLRARTTTRRSSSAR